MTNEQKQKWADEYGSKLESLEKKSAKSFQRFLKDEYFKGVDSFLNTSSDREFVSLFKLSELKELYVDLYKNIGTEFAVWYEKSFDKLLKKGNGDRNTWSRTFEQYGNTEAGKKISIVQGTALKEIRSTIGRLFKDEEFQKLGRQQQGRILKERFSGISQYQAERIVRTEATAAANQGIMQSATDIFPKGSLMKEWISSSDSRTRRFSKGDKADHAQMASHPPIPYDELFQVPTRAGAQRMFRPADSSHGASAYNVINCRCSIAVYPMEGADVREGVELTGFGGGVAARTTQLVGNQIVTSRKPAQEVVEQVTEAKPKRSKYYPKKLDDMRAEGYDINEAKFTDLLTEDVSLNLNRTSSYASKNEVNINIKRYGKGKMINQILAHEFGHAIHNQRGWAVYNYLDKRKPTVNPIVKKYFDKWKKQLGIGRGTSLELRQELSKVVDTPWRNLRDKFPELTEREFLEYHASMADFFGAITKNRIGYGHSNSYYAQKGVYRQYAEMLANTFENYYHGNPVFKKLVPEFYEESLKMLQELIDETL